jgi:replicative DNA helicase
MIIAGIPSEYRLEDLYVESRMLCAFLLNANDERAELLTLEVDHFHDWNNALAFTAMRNLEARSETIDIANMVNWIDGQGKGEAFDIALVVARALAMPDYQTLAQLRRDLEWLAQLKKRREDAIAIEEREKRRKGNRS